MLYPRLVLADNSHRIFLFTMTWEWSVDRGSWILVRGSGLDWMDLTEKFIPDTLIVYLDFKFYLYQLLDFALGSSIFVSFLSSHIVYKNTSTTRRHKVDLDYYPLYVLGRNICSILEIALVFFV